MTTTNLKTRKNAKKTSARKSKAAEKQVQDTSVADKAKTDVQNAESETKPKRTRKQKQNNASPDSTAATATSNAAAVQQADESKPSKTLAIDLGDIEVKPADPHPASSTPPSTPPESPPAPTTAAAPVKAATVVWNIPRFSLIIPCHNNSGYIVRCLSSIKNQTFDLSKVEVIAIDDASTDGSADILEAFGEKWIPNFTLVKNDKNVGVGATRNAGLGHATGKYVFYIDCDDSITEKALERIDAALVKANDPDVAFIPFRTVKAGAGQSTDFKPTWNDIRQTAGCAPGPWAKVIKRSVAVPFPVGFRGEDTVWNFPQLDKFNTFCNVEGDEPCYLYDRTNASAITDTLAWSAENGYTLEFLAKDNTAIKAGKNDRFFSDIMRAIAAMYDSRHSLTKPWVKTMWFIRFQSMYQSMVCGHFHN